MYAAFLLKHRHIGKALTTRAYIFGHKSNQVESANYLPDGRNAFTESRFSEQQSRCAVVDLLHDEYGWSDSVSNLSAKLQRESIRYKEVVELADALGYELIWQKRREK